MKSKKGAFGHIEIILSFIIFAGFVLFLFVFLNPLKKATISEQELDIAERSIFNNLKIQLNYTTINVETIPGGQICFEFNYITDSNIYVEDISGERVPAKAEGGKIYIQGTGGFYYIYFSSEFGEDSVSNCYSNPITEIGTKKKLEVLYYPYIEEFKLNYEENYEGLKENLGITTDYGFVIYDSLREIEKINIMKDKTGREIFSVDKGYQMLYQNGSREYVKVNLQIW